MLRRFLIDSGLRADLTRRAELLVEEIVMNVAMHGFDDPADAQVALHASVRPAACVLVIQDAGRPFDPTASEIPRRRDRIEDASPGGLGLVLLRRLADRIGYRRLPDGLNEVTITLVAPAKGSTELGE